MLINSFSPRFCELANLKHGEIGENNSCVHVRFLTCGTVLRLDLMPDSSTARPATSN